jgi:hypothetical protein
VLPLVLVLPDGNLFFSNKKNAPKPEEWQFKRHQKTDGSRPENDVGKQRGQVLVVCDYYRQIEQASGYGRSCSNY